MNIRSIATKATASAAMLSLVVAPNLFAAGTTVLTTSELESWTQSGATATVVTDASAPGGEALQLKTDATNNSYTDNRITVNKPISEVTKLSYMSKTLTGPDYASASFAVGIDTNGDLTPEKYYSFEPYWQNGGNADAAPVVANQWQTWDVTNGLFWTDGTAGPPFYTWAEVVAANPGATVEGVYTYVGTSNPNYTVNVDNIVVNDTTYNFQTKAKTALTSKDQCKNDGWKSLTKADGSTFKNQGQCVSYVATGQAQADMKASATTNQ